MSSTSATASRGAAMELRCEGLTVTAGPLRLVEQLNLSLTPGIFIGVLGCNGAGKSSLLRVLAGLDDAAAGRVCLAGRELARWRRRDLARVLGMLLQDDVSALPLSVEERVLLGRHPHLGFWDTESAADIKRAHAALAQVGLAGFGTRVSSSLSGGEWRRVCIAALLAQQPEIYLLDEPLNHLDPRHQRDVLGICSELAANGRTLIASFHDPNQVARHCDAALLLFGPEADGEWCYGAAADVLGGDNLSRLYGLSRAELRAAFQSRLEI